MRLHETFLIGKLVSWNKLFILFVRNPYTQTVYDIYPYLCSSCAICLEQMEIAKSKSPGELLNWDDVNKMRYSWNVACEVMRLAPPIQGAFREAINGFIFNGFSIPKGWKVIYIYYDFPKIYKHICALTIFSFSFVICIWLKAYLYVLITQDFLFLLLNMVYG